MNTRSFRVSALAYLLLAIATPAFGGRMIGPVDSVPFPEEKEVEATEGAITEMDDEGEESEIDPDMQAEVAEDIDEDVAVEADPGLPPSRWKWGRSLSLRMAADDNIYLSSRNQESDVIFTLAGNFRALWGLKRDESFLSIDYSPSLLVFADHSDANGFDQRLGIAGQWRIAKLTLSAQAGAQTLSGGDVDVGDRANRSLWHLTLRAKYDYSTKTSIEVSLSPNASNYSRYLDSMEWVNSNWIDYQAFPKTRVGAGITFGYLKAEGGTAQTFQQALLRVSNPVSGKLTVNASGGVEMRQLGDQAGNQITPVFRDRRKLPALRRHRDLRGSIASDL